MTTASTPRSLLAEGQTQRLDVLDGWRGLSILSVLASHMLPLGPKGLRLNDTAGPLGMALFFTLSGFLITRFLLHRSHVGDFLVRRFTRILPLAWLALLITLPLVNAPADFYLPNFLFYANLPPQHLTEAASHFWSLGVEMQFYLGVALLAAVAGKRGLLALPVVCVAVSLHRIQAGTPVDIVTWRRVDEILAGATLALAFSGQLGLRPTQWLGRINAWWVLPVFLASCHPASGPLNYLRPYLAALMVGATLVSPTAWQTRLLTRKSLVYIATISFALYVIHHLLMYTWLGEGDTKVIKYIKRVPLFLLTFALAHVSTFYFEHPCMNLGKRLSRKLGWSAAPPPQTAMTAD